VRRGAAPAVFTAVQTAFSIAEKKGDGKRRKSAKILLQCRQSGIGKAVSAKRGRSRAMHVDFCKAGMQDFGKPKISRILKIIRI
jgi:hypothetical protein